MDIDWQRAARSIVNGASEDPEILAAMRWHTLHKVEPIDNVHMVLAVCCSMIGEANVQLVVPGEQGAKLHRAARTAMRLVDATPAAPVISRPPESGSVAVETRLARFGLPHLGLVAELARDANRPFVVTTSDDLPPGVSGQYQRCGRVRYPDASGELVDGEATVILLRLASDTVVTWRHELAHALDWRGFGDEHYADALADLLMRYQPDSLAEVGPLIVEADRARLPVRTRTEPITAEAQFAADLVAEAELLTWFVSLPIGVLAT